MKKKFILLTLIGTYLTFIIFNPLALAAISSEISFIVDNTEIQDPIELSKSEEITIKLNYKLNIGTLLRIFYFHTRIGRLTFGLFKGYFFKYLRRPLPKANLTLSVDKPDWCEVELNKYAIEFDYKNGLKDEEVLVKINVKENAPALQKSGIKIIADCEGLGPIVGVSNSTNISFMAAYVSNISIDAETNFTIPPLKETMIPINITNNGNGEGVVSIQILDQEDWNITLDQDDIVIGVGEEKQVMMTVTPPKKFDNITINLTFEPLSTVEDVESSYRNGTNVNFGITFYNDRSLKDEDKIDLTTVLIIAFVIIIALIIVAFILKKKE